MKILFDLEKIKTVVTSFYKLTNLVISFCDTTFVDITSSNYLSDFCACVTKNHSKMCKECDLYHLMEAKKAQQKLTYSCHMGIAESIIPIFYDNNIIAYVMMGQYRDAEGIYSSESKMLEATKNTSIDKDNLILSYNKLPIFSEEQLQAAFHILDQLITLMWKNEILKPDNESIYSQIDNYIDNHLDEKISVSALCKVFFISKNTLYKMFQQDFNMPVNKYIVYRRLSHSVNLLKNTSFTITTIASLSGFSDINYFNRLFKKTFKITPSKFRKQLLENPTFTLPKI